MFRKTSIGVFILAGLLVAFPVGQVTAAGNVPGVQGVWTCSVVRAGTIQRPIIYTFNSDGTFNYSSGTTINSVTAGPVQIYRVPQQRWRTWSVDQGQLQRR